MTDPTAAQKILADLATVHQIANRPHQQNPLIAVILQQGMALAEVSVWAQNAQQLLAREARADDGQDEAS